MEEDGRRRGCRMKAGGEGLKEEGGKKEGF